MILVAGVGNIFHGDDAFGSEAARRLIEVRLPPAVRVVDFGIRGHDLAFALQDGYETALLVDTAQRGKTPGSLSVIEPDLDSVAFETIGAGIDTHAMPPLRLLRWLRAQEAKVPRLCLVCCEPATFGPDEGHIGLSDAVAAAVPEAVALVQSLVENWVR